MKSRTDLAGLAHDIRTTTGRVTRALRDRGGRLGLTASQLEALGFVERDGAMTVTTLANRVGVRSQSMGATVGVLEEQGLVTVTPDPADGRQKVIALTDHGRDRIATSRSLREDWLALRIEETLTEAERARLRDALDLLVRLVSD
jgi:DNA-binding MarR family transcriptional regulator